MLIAITGASGFIGSHLIDSLLERGWKIRALIHLTPPHRPEIEAVRGEINQVKDLRSLCDGADWVFHLASAMGSAQLKANEFYRINVEGTKALLRAAKEAGIKRFIHISSAGVLGAVSSGVIADEQYPPHPITIYDQTKAMAEAFALHEAKKGLDVVIVRPGWVYGPRDRRTLKLFRAIKKKFFFFVGDGQGRQTPIWIGDLIQGLMLAAEKGKKGEIYHLAGSEILTVKEMVEKIAQAMQVKLTSLHLPSLPLKLVALAFDRLGLWLHREMPINSSRLSFFLHSKPLAIEKAKKELGFKPKINFRTGLSLTVNWYIENRWL